jgi:hypothetical protein
MANGIRGLLRGRGDEPGGVEQHTVGNALVLHSEEKISSEAQSLALSVVADAENDIVVLDLGDGMPINSWESMAGVLPKRRRGIRLVACGRHHNTAAMAGQWLSERLGRTVIAPDGDLVRGSAGTLFVHSAPGSGWVRFRPGKPPAWDAKRYPAPLWDQAVVDNRASSSVGEIEPLPGGVWIHDTRDAETVSRHRERLVSGVPCQPDRMTVLLGCPGTPPLSLDDVVRFWRELDEDVRARARFVQYGDVKLPEGETFGQTLADLLGTNIVCYTGVPIGSPGRFELRTVRPDGSLGWPPFALELTYLPRAHPNSRARRPSMLSHRAPLRGTEEITPRVYWYAPDAVVEIVQSGLWIRGAEEPANAERVRGAVLDPEGGTLIFDDTVAERTARMRDLAADLAARLDDLTAAGSALVPASVLVPGMKPAGRAGAAADVDSVAKGVQASAPMPRAVAAVAAVEQPQPTAMPGIVVPAVAAPTVAAVPAPAVAPEAKALQRYLSDQKTQAVMIPTAEQVRAYASGQTSAVQPPAPATGEPVRARATVTPPPLPPPTSDVPAPIGKPGPPPEPATEATLHAAPVEVIVLPKATRLPADVEPPAAVEPPPPLEAPAPPAPPVAPVAPLGPDVAPPLGPDVAPPLGPDVAPPLGPDAVAPPVESGLSTVMEVTVPGISLAEPVAAPALDGPSAPGEPVGTRPPAAPTVEPPPPAAPTVDPAAPTVEPKARTVEPAPGVRAQPVPEASASALLPSRPLDEERGWLRRTLSREFDTLASSVARIMSEHPGMQSAGLTTDDLLADSVAVRLFLSARGPGIDAGLRAGRNGPHVPLARCAVSGLSRLPSFRGTTVFRMSPADDEWQLYSDRRVLTDWGFVTALTQPDEAQDGDTDVLVWSMTGRRTGLLEPEGDEHIDDRVVYLPGTSFKVLELREPSSEGRGAILMREIGSNEIDDHGRVDPDRVSLDELAVTALNRSLERWAGGQSKRRIGSAARARFDVLPGLERRR